MCHLCEFFCPPISDTLGRINTDNNSATRQQSSVASSLTIQSNTNTSTTSRSSSSISSITSSIARQLPFLHIRCRGEDTEEINPRPEVYKRTGLNRAEAAENLVRIDALNITR